MSAAAATPPLLVAEPPTATTPPAAAVASGNATAPTSSVVHPAQPSLPETATSTGATLFEAPVSTDPPGAADGISAGPASPADAAAGAEPAVKTGEVENGTSAAVKVEVDGTAADTGVAPPEGGRRVSTRDIQLVQNLIERCLQLYMSQREVVSTLHAQAEIEPGFTGLVWQKLEEQNPDFFRAYYTRLKLKDQILLFNHLLDQQVAVVQRMQWSRPMQPAAPAPALPQGMAGGLLHGASSGGPPPLGGPAVSAPHGGSDHEGATFSGGSDLRPSLPTPDLAELDRLHQGPGGAASAALASPPLFVGDVAGGSGGAHGGLGGLGTGHMSHDNLLGLGGHFPGTSPLQFPSTSGDQTGTIPHVFSLSDLKFDLGMDEDNHAALGDSMINTESLDNL